MGGKEGAGDLVQSLHQPFMAEDVQEYPCNHDHRHFGLDTGRCASLWTCGVSCTYDNSLRTSGEKIWYDG